MVETLFTLRDVQTKSGTPIKKWLIFTLWNNKQSSFLPVFSKLHSCITCFTSHTNGISFVPGNVSMLNQLLLTHWVQGADVVAVKQTHIIIRCVTASPLKAPVSTWNRRVCWMEQISGSVCFLCSVSYPLTACVVCRFGNSSTQLGSLELRTAS